MHRRHGLLVSAAAVVVDDDGGDHTSAPGEKEEKETAASGGEETGGEAKRKSSRGETARRLRHSSKRYLTNSFTAIIDTLAISTAMKKRTRSCERDKPDPAAASAPTDAASTSSVVNVPSSASFDSSLAAAAAYIANAVRPGSVSHAQSPPQSCGGGSGGRRFSEQMSLSPPSVGGEAGTSPSSRMGVQFSVEETEEKYLKRAQSKLQELLLTERTYVERNLKEVVEGYLGYMDAAKADPEGHVKTPADLLGGKDRIIFGNIRDINDFHKRTMYPELEKAVANPRILRTLFETKGNVLKQKYGRYCLNKPKSEYIISCNDKYFAVLRLKQGFEQALSTQMMTPVQRVTRYQLLLREIEKNFRLAAAAVASASASVVTADEGEDDAAVAPVDADCSSNSSSSELELIVRDVGVACEFAHDIAEYANDMMFAGRIKGFNEDVTAQGLLLKRGQAICFKRKNVMKKPKLKQCQFFVFQESIIICENPQQTSETAFPPYLDYFASFKINKVIVREIVKNGTVFGFELERQESRCNPERISSGGGGSGTGNGGKELSSSSSFPVLVVHCESEDQRDEWLKTINDQIRELKTLALNLENPQQCH